MTKQSLAVNRRRLPQEALSLDVCASARQEKAAAKPHLVFAQTRTRPSFSVAPRPGLSPGGALPFCSYRIVWVGDGLEGGVHQCLVQVQHQGFLVQVLGVLGADHWLPVHPGRLRGQLVQRVDELQVGGAAARALWRGCHAAQQVPQAVAPAAAILGLLQLQLLLLVLLFLLVRCRLLDLQCQAQGAAADTWAGDSSRLAYGPQALLGRGRFVVRVGPPGPSGRECWARHTAALQAEDPGVACPV